VCCESKKRHLNRREHRELRANPARNHREFVRRNSPGISSSYCLCALCGYFQSGVQRKSMEESLAKISLADLIADMKKA
jgi:hypothetical protein